MSAPPPHSSSAPNLSTFAPEALDLTLSDMSVGREASFSWQAKTADIDGFAALSGDHNPLHMDDSYARENAFDGRVVHGFLLAAQVSGLIGMALPGRRCLLMEEKLAFPNPVYAGDTVVFLGRVKEVHEELSLIILKVTAHKDGQTVVRGRVTCKLLS